MTQAVLLAPGIAVLVISGVCAVGLAELAAAADAEEQRRLVRQLAMSSIGMHRNAIQGADRDAAEQAP